jgi:large subunit ribosomal protein L21
MKYAIVEISGRQFWIETGKYYDFNRIPTELGKQITLNRVLLLKKKTRKKQGHRQELTRVLIEDIIII